MGDSKKAGIKKSTAQTAQFILQISKVSTAASREKKRRSYLRLTRSFKLINQMYFFGRFSLQVS